MDINLLGIGAVIGATVVAGTNLYIFQENRKKDEMKERLEKLYTPMFVYYLEQLKYYSEKSNLDLYNDYLALKKIYISNSIYASDNLKQLFEDLIWKESEIIDKSLEDRASEISNLTFRDDKGLDRDFIYMIDRITGYIDREHDELQIYYAKGKIERFLWRLQIHDNPKYAKGTLPAGRSF